MKDGIIPSEIQLKFLKKCLDKWVHFKDTAKLVKNYNDYAKELKSTTVNITSAADDWLRAGKSMNEAPLTSYVF